MAVMGKWPLWGCIPEWEYGGRILHSMNLLLIGITICVIMTYLEIKGALTFLVVESLASCLKHLLWLHPSFVYVTLYNTIGY
jgi:hypothetical protein